MYMPRTIIINIIITVEPTVAVKPDYLVANEFEEVSFTCSSTGIPVPEIRWYRNGTEITDETERFVITEDGYSMQPGSLLTQYNETLTISNMVDTDNGTYTCVAIGVSNASVEFHLTVNCELYNCMRKNMQ